MSAKSVSHSSQGSGSTLYVATANTNAAAFPASRNLTLQQLWPDPCVPTAGDSNNEGGGNTCPQRTEEGGEPCLKLAVNGENKDKNIRKTSSLLVIMIILSCWL